MAKNKKRLNALTKMVKYGYGYVEGNKLSARYNGAIFAQLPAAKELEVIENGRFLKYDYGKGECNLTGPGEWLLVFNEVKVYDRFETDADFAMVPFASPTAVPTVGVSYSESVLTPRLFGTEFGDTMTTNTIKDEFDSIAVDDYLIIDTDGYLKKSGTELPKSGQAWQVVKKYTMPDLQPGVKIMRVQ